MTFEEKLKRVDEICALMDGGKLTLDESIKLYEEGMILAKECLDVIEKTKGKVVEIKKKVDGTIEEEDLDSGK